MEEEQEVEYESGSATSSSVQGHQDQGSVATGSGDKDKDKVNDMIYQQEKEEGEGGGADEVEGSGRGRGLCLKLKIGVAAIGNPHLRVCRICKKGFSSGKALGGHMRMHAMANRKNSEEETGNNNNLMSESLVDDGKQNCRVCGKDFPSMKSLFGHMRCHPEREWRGIQPPVPVPPISSSCTIEKPINSWSSSEYSTLSDDHHPIVDSTTCAGAVIITRPHSDSDSVVDLSRRLSIGWSVTAKRGRKSNSAGAGAASSSGSGLEPRIEHRTQEAIYQLMMLAYANPKPNHPTLTHQSHSHSDPANSITWEEEEQESPAANRKRKRDDATESTPSAESESVSAASHNSNDSSTVGEPLNCGPETSRRMMVMINKKINKRLIKKVKLTDLETGEGDNKDQTQLQIQTNKYICSLCNKSFPSHQALGGHRSSHKKSKIIQNIKDIVESESKDMQLDATQADVEVNSGHQCNICNRTFPTGQALGGHKRSHWTGNAETIEPHAKSAQAPAPAPAQTTLHAETSQAHPPMLLDFDLNELPAMDEQDQEVNAPSASASASGSSSHKSVTN